jgi:hypothetical protein
MFASYFTTVAGRSGHALDRGISVGASWSFGTARNEDLIGGDAVRSELPRCLCQKGKSSL